MVSLGVTKQDMGSFFEPCISFISHICARIGSGTQCEITQSEYSTGKCQKMEDRMHEGDLGCLLTFSVQHLRTQALEVQFARGVGI